MLGYINLPALIALVAGTLLTVRLGVAAADWLPSRTLAGLFALFLVFNGAQLLHSACGDEVPQISTRKPRLLPLEF
jgi:uncharacterized protein